MRKKAPLVVTGLLAGATISVATGSPANAQVCVSTDPVIAYVCYTIDNAPELKPTIQHYYDTAGAVVKFVYCTLWDDPTCP